MDTTKADRSYETTNDDDLELANTGVDTVRSTVN
jgi:hypothetical protein